MSLANETDGGRGTSFSMNDKWMPPANVMERVVIGVCSEIGVWGMNESVGCAASPVFGAVFQKGMRGSTMLDGADTCRRSDATVS